MPTRRTFVTGLLAGLGAASPAAAQFGNLLQQLPGGGGGGGGGLDLNRLLGAAGSIFEGMQLGPSVRESRVRREAPSYLTACGLAMRRFAQ